MPSLVDHRQYRKGFANREPHAIFGKLQKKRKYKIMQKMPEKICLSSFGVMLVALRITEIVAASGATDGADWRRTEGRGRLRGRRWRAVVPFMLHESMTY